MATDYVNLGPNSPVKLLDGWLQHKGAQDKAWARYWCVIKDFTIYIFKSQTTSRENHIGILDIDSDTQFRIGESDTKKSVFRFDLYAAKRLNKFKTSKFSERELWKAYIIGLSKGDVPDDVDLLPGQIQKVRDDLQLVLRKSQRPLLPIPKPTHTDPSSAGTGFMAPSNGVSDIFPTGAAKPAASNAEPMIRHRFWNDPEKNDIPSWFYAAITRDIAESILASGNSFGNTLMRESVTFRNTGSYVISKKMEHNSNTPFNHFEVIKMSDGFKINVENAHQSMKCLSDVMSYFVSMSGAAVTRPMISNDFKTLGLDTPPYQKHIMKTAKEGETGEMIQEDYLEPGPQHQTLPSRFRSPAFTNHRGGVATISPGQIPARSQLNVENIERSVRTADALSTLDTAISRHDADSSQHHRQVRHMEPAPPPPGPPPDARRTSQPDIVLRPAKRDHPPRFYQRAKSVPNIEIPKGLFPLDQEVPVGVVPPSIVKPSKTPGPRTLPKPRARHESVDEIPLEEEEEQGLSSFAQQLRGVTTQLRRVGETSTGEPKKQKGVRFADQTQEAESREIPLREDFKRHLEEILMGGGSSQLKSSSTSTKRDSATHTPLPPTPRQPQTAAEEEVEEEEYDVIYEPID